MCIAYDIMLDTATAYDTLITTRYSSQITSQIIKLNNNKIMTKKVYIKRNDLFRRINLLLCNEIVKADSEFLEDNIELFQSECDICKGSGEIDGKTCEECNGNSYFDSEPYQYFLTSVNDYDKEIFKEYGIEFGYSKLLELEVLPIYDFGTSWDCFSYSKEVEEDYILRPYESLTRTTVY